MSFNNNFLKSSTVDVVIMIGIFSILNKIFILLYFIFGINSNVLIINSIATAVIGYLLSLKIRKWISVK